MQVRATYRCLLPISALLLSAAAAAQAPTKPSPVVPAGQSSTQLPALAPTYQPAPLAAAPLNEPVAHKSQRATVTYAAGLLNVRANDSSLNSILREIARVTGMTIDGGVADQRVFGNYGPAEPSTVLATLLDGTGTNLFIKEATNSSPAQLTLTPRGGGPTPPSPSSAEYSEQNEDQVPDQPSSPVRGAVPTTSNPGMRQIPIAGADSGPGTIQQSPPTSVFGNPNAVSPSASTLPVTNSVPTDSLPVPATAQSPAGIVSAPSGPPQGTTTYGFSAAAQAAAASASTPTNTADTTGSNTPGGSTGTDTAGSAPGSVRTPEQIFELLKQQQDQAKRAVQGSQSGTRQAATPATATPDMTPRNPQ